MFPTVFKFKVLLYFFSANFIYKLPIYINMLDSCGFEAVVSHNEIVLLKENKDSAELTTESLLTVWF